MPERNKSELRSKLMEKVEQTRSKLGSLAKQGANISDEKVKELIAKLEQLVQVIDNDRPTSCW